VVETRLADHPHRPRAQQVLRRSRKKRKWIEDPGGRGIQIVREVRACPSCAAKAMALERRGEPSVERMRPDEKLAS
jgi:hypothetical protein